MDIAKSVVLITAAGTPTGCAMAEHFCALGANVAIIDTDKARLDKTHTVCLQKYPNCFAFLLEKRDVKKINQLFEEIKQQLGSIDVLINYWQINLLPNLLIQEPLAESSVSDVASSLYMFGRCAAANMIEKDIGVIINIPGIQSIHQSEHDIKTSNTVIRGLTLSWGQELEHTNIRVGGVLPKIRLNENGQITPQATINFDMIDSAVYIVENDSFTSRVIEAC